MGYSNPDIEDVSKLLKIRQLKLDNRFDILKSIELKSLYSQIPTMPENQRAEFGKEMNKLKAELEDLANQKLSVLKSLQPIDVTAPFDVSIPFDQKPKLLPAENGSLHPLTTELKEVVDIFGRMGFVHLDSREIDDEFHMFDSLNFAQDHPARDEYDTFITTEGLIAPAHVSVMQNRLQKQYLPNLKINKPISVVYTGRTFRNEDVDARHEHTFYQVEITYIDKNINAGNLMATFKTFLEEYYGQKLEIKSQPFYFPFTEPSFELALSCPFCQKKGCNICSHTGWIELLGMGMINPNVLEMGGIDPKIYTGFAGGLGLDRLVMMKYGIEDVRSFHSGKLEFLRQFS